MFIFQAVGTLLLRLGFALHDTGMVRSKNAAGAIARKVADLAVCTLAFWLLGAAIALPRSHWFLNWTLIASSDMPLGLLAIALIATAIPGAALGERSRFLPLLAVSLVLGMVVVPLGMRWTLGFLGDLGMRDEGFAAAVHLAGAIFALVGVKAVGARQGKYNIDGSSNAIPGHSMPIASIGVLVIFLSWVPYLGVTTLAATNVLLSASAGILVSLVFCQVRYEKPDIHLIYAGLLGALVAIVPGAALLASWKAVLIGAAAGLLVPAFTLYLDLVLKIDDVGGGIAVHGVGAIWGLLATALLSWDRGFVGFFKGVFAQVLGIALIGALATACAMGLFMGLARITKLRSKEADEYDGLDLAEHDVGSYPDFQQTMIKSYHLREA